MELTSIPNVGPAVAGKLARLGLARSEDLRGRDPEELFEHLCTLDGQRHDPCLLDTFVAAVSYANGNPARPWWRASIVLNVIQRQLGHSNLGITSVYFEGIDSAEIIDTIHARPAPMMPASAGLRLDPRLH